MGAMRYRFRLDARWRRPGILMSRAGASGLLALLLAVGAVGITAWAQHGGPPGSPSNGADAANPGDDANRPSPLLQEQMANRRNDERQRQLVADTNKLLLLAQQLHDEVSKSNKDELSISVVKTSGEIEKLARSVKDKMRGY